MVSQELMPQKAVETLGYLRWGRGGFWKNWAAAPGAATPQGRESGSCLLIVVTLSKMGYDKKKNNNNSMFLRKSTKGNHCSCRSSLSLTVSDKLLFISNVSWELLMTGCLPSTYGALISMLSISKYVKEKKYIKCAHLTDFNPNAQVFHQILTFGYTIKTSTYWDSAVSLNTADKSQRDEKRQKWII